MASRKPSKGPGKRKSTPHATRLRRTPSNAKARRPSQLEATRNDLRDALDRQAAVSEVLAAIGRAGSDPQPVFDLALAHAGRLCHAQGGVLWLRDGDHFRITAGWSVSGVSAEAFMDYERHHPALLDNQGVTGRAYRTGVAAQIPDVTVEPGYDHGQLKYLGAAHTTRTLLGVPLLLRDGAVIGVLSLAHRTVQPFSEHDIAVVQTFADQAVLAVESARLLNETHEALERQTAIAEVLEAMSGSAGDLDKVFKAIVENAVRICSATNGGLFRIEANTFRLTASAGTFVQEPQTDDVAFPRQAMAIAGRDSLTGRVLLERRTQRIDDIRTDAEYQIPRSKNAYVIRSMVGVPIVRSDEILGVIVARRAELRPFSPREVDILETFARQAAIAIENVRLFSEIQQKSAELAAASRHKSEFMANMSHELRTPLNAVIGFSDVLEERLFGELNERQSEYVRDIAGSGRHLLELVNEILDLSKVEAGRMELDLSEFALAETIRGALAFVRERAVRQSIALTAEHPADLGRVVADERKIRQVLLNLLSNAVKFTPDGGTIAVRASRDSGEVQVSVQDTGIGIAAEDQGKVFDEFQQVGKATDRPREGTGLGLTLAKRFVELHGGRIRVESEVGKGTTFTFAIPVDGTAPAPVPTRSDDGAQSERRA